MTTSGSPQPTYTRSRPTRQPSDLIVGGVGVVVVGWVIALGLAAATGTGGLPFLLGWAASMIGGLMLFVGAVAAGVRLGMQWAEHDRRG